MSSFPDFFHAATGRSPFPFQSAFAEAERPPELLTVPTGCGKTATVVLGWLWRRREAPPGLRASTPRRLVYTLPVRTLVEQTADEARRWREKLGLGDVGIHVLMGGAVDERWEARPEADTLLVGTQDQLLSRALMRGYAMSPFRWPIHFALLHTDAWWIFDETQLMGPALSTSAQLEGFRRSLGTALPTCSTWMSATNAPGRLATVDLRAHVLRAQGLGEADRADAALAARLDARKRLERLPASADLVAETLRRHARGTRTLVVVNRVARAVELAEGLRKRVGKEKSGVEVRLVHSRFRPADRAAEQKAALAEGFDGIVVATQAIEAGVDISSRTLVTELAAWSSLIQRFGRCNRRGEYPADDPATVVVVDVADKDAAPYEAEALADARSRLDRLADVGPTALAAVAPEDAAPTLPVIRKKDLLELFDTEPDLAGRHIDVSRYLRESDDRDVQLAWRDLAGKAPAEDEGPLQSQELCSVDIGRARKLLAGKDAWRWDGQEGGWEPVPTAFGQLRMTPGEALLVDLSVGGYEPRLGFTGDPKHRPEPALDRSRLATADADGRDPMSFGYGDYVGLRQHAEDAAAAMAELARAVDAPVELLVRAARWHDRGKAHPYFQQLLTAALAPDDPRTTGGPWAKSDGRQGKVADRRPAFRHELASALGWLAQGGDDLTAYLVAAHHGKLRLRLRSRPQERPIGGAMPVLGVLPGDQLPETDLGAGDRAVGCSLDTSLAAVGAEGGAWADRTLGLLEEHGPFVLAWWETLVRLADWRASALRNPGLRET